MIAPEWRAGNDCFIFWRQGGVDDAWGGLMRMSLIDRLFRRVPPPVALAEGPDLSDAGAMSLAEVSVCTGWTAGQLAQAEALWGEGCVWPGGAEEFKRLAAPLELSPAHSLIVLGDGAAGAARVLAADLGAWVSAYESDKVLHDAAEDWRKRGGAALAKRATVAVWDKARAVFPARGFHHAMLLDGLSSTSGAPEQTALVLSGLARAVKAGGQIVVVQTVEGPEDDAAIVVALEQAGCDVRVVEDESARHARLVLHAWKLLLRRLRESRPTPAEAAALVQEAAIWLIRLRGVREGRIRVMRWGAIVG